MSLAKPKLMLQRKNPFLDILKPEDWICDQKLIKSEISWRRHCFSDLKNSLYYVIWFYSHIELIIKIYCSSLFCFSMSWWYIYVLSMLFCIYKLKTNSYILCMWLWNAILCASMEYKVFLSSSSSRLNHLEGRRNDS